MALDQNHATAGGGWQDGAWRWHDDQGWRHRVDGPAVIHADGRHEWWYRDWRHRTDGPAVVYADGWQEWWLHGRRHRVDGPAYIDAAGRQLWYVQGRNITSEVEAWMQAHNITWPFTAEQLMEFQLRWA